MRKTLGMNGIFLITPKPCYELLAPKFLSLKVSLIWLETVEDLESLVLNETPSLKPDSTALDSRVTNHAHRSNFMPHLGSGRSSRLNDGLVDAFSLGQFDWSQYRLLSVFSDCVVPLRIFEKFGLGFYNFHPGPPERPGWAPLNYALYDGDRSFGVTLHEAIEKVDGGPIIAVQEFRVPEDSNYHSLASLTFEAFLDLFELFLPQLLSDEKLVPQNQRTTWNWGLKKKTKKDLAKDAWVYIDTSPRELIRKIKAFGMSNDICRLKIEFQGKIYAFDPLRQTQNFFNLVNECSVASRAGTTIQPQVTIRDDYLETWGVRFHPY
jgi:methionyl-tRNA formyltransferase